MCENSGPRPKSALTVQFGTVSSLYRERPPLPLTFPSLFPSGYRTRVTILPARRGYRFFSLFSAEYPRATALQQYNSARAFARPTLLSRNHCPGLLAQASRGHACLAANGSRRWLLLPLCGIAPARRLRQDVRFKALCFPLAGHQVCETPHAHAGQ